MNDERIGEQRFIVPPEHIKLYESGGLNVLRAIANSDMSVLLATLVCENPGLDAYAIFRGMHNVAGGKGEIKSLDTDLDEPKRKSKLGIQMSTFVWWLSQMEEESLFDVRQVSTERRGNINNVYFARDDKKEVLQGAIGLLIDLSEKYGPLSAFFSRASSPVNMINGLNILKVLASMGQEYGEGFSVKLTKLMNSSGVGQVASMMGHLESLQQLGILEYVQHTPYMLNVGRVPFYQGRRNSMTGRVLSFFRENRGKSFTIAQIRDAMTSKDEEIEYTAIANAINALSKREIIYRDKHGISVTGDQARKIQKIVEIVDAIIDPEQHRELLQEGRKSYNAFIQNPKGVLDFFLKAVRNSTLDPTKVDYMVNEINASKAAYIEREISDFLKNGGLLQYAEEEKTATLTLRGTKDYTQIIDQLDPAIGKLFQNSPSLQVYRDVQGSRTVLNFSLGEGAIKTAFTNKKPLHQSPQYAEKFVKGLHGYIENVCRENNLPSDSVSLDKIFASLAS